MKSSTAWSDLSAVAVSGLCLLHCLALPVLAALLPMFGAWSRAEWVHGVFVAVALPLSVHALRHAHRVRPLPAALWLGASLGLALLLAGACGWPDARGETPLTVAGSLLLAAMHAWNALRRRPSH